MIFVDTSAWFATTVPSEITHETATAWFGHNKEPLLTTDYVIDETLTPLRARNQAHLAISLGERFFSGELAEIHYLTEDDILAAWDVFRRFSDKDWSFTDCTSKVVMERIGIATAFAFDQHLRQFGTVSVVP
jgi:predicted nucleic acid-binding protein